MKKLITITLFLFFVYVNSYSQSDGFEFKFNGNTAKYDKETNSGTFNGFSAGSFEINSMMLLSAIDTSIWRYIQNTNNAKYSYVENKTSYSGIDSGKIRLPIIDLIGNTGGSSFDTSLFVKKSAFYYNINNTFTGKQTFDSITANVLNNISLSRYFSTSNLDTSNIAFLNQQNTFTENQKVPVLAIGSSGINPIPRVAVGITIGDSNMIGFNLVNTTINQTRNSQIQATDTSSASIRLSRWLGNPIMDFRNNAGVLTFSIDTLGTVLTNSYFVLGGSSGSSIRNISGARVGIYSADGNTFGTLVANEVRLGNGLRGMIGMSADGVSNIVNNAGTGFTSFTVGGSSIIAGFIRGTTLTTATGWFSKSPDGTTWYSYVNNAGAIVTANTLF